MQESRDAYFFKKKQKDMEKLSKNTYNKVRKWTVDHHTMEHTQAPDMMTEKERKKYEREKRQLTQNSMLEKSGSIHQFQTETKANALGG